MEIWNLVFSQYDADGKGNYELLAKPNIDTGMGLERLAVVMQDVNNLFEVDTVAAVLHHVERIAGKKYEENEKDDISIRVITDTSVPPSLWHPTASCPPTRAAATFCAVCSAALPAMAVCWASTARS